MRSAFAARQRSATVDSLRRVACQPKLETQLASEGWTTDMFVEAVFNGLNRKK